VAEDTQTSVADDFRRRFIEAVADGEAPDLDELRRLVADDPWRYREALGFAGDTLGGVGVLFAAHAFAADERGDLRQAALLWRITYQEAEQRWRPPLVEVARRRIEQLRAAGSPASTNVSISVRGVLAGQLAVGGLISAGALATLLQEGHGRLGGNRLAEVSFDDRGVARLALAWVADAYHLYADAPPPTVLDTSLVLLHLADRDADVARALEDSGCAASLREEAGTGGQPVHSWRPVTDDVLTALAPEARSEPIVDRSGAGPVLVGSTGGIRDESLYVGIRPDGDVAIDRVRTGLPVETGSVVQPLVAEGVRDLVPHPTLVAVGGDAHRPVVAAGSADGEVALWWPLSGRIERGPAPVSGLTCLAVGGGPDPVVVHGDASGGILVGRLHDGELVLRVPTGSPVRDVDVADLAGRLVCAALGDSGDVSIWDLVDLRPVTSPRQVIGGVGRVRFGQVGEDPALLARDLGNAPQVRRLVWVRVADEIPEYRSDATSQARHLPLGDDALGRETEADAIAEVITSASVEPPLAIGLFGEWGEGKSWFMERIQAHVDDRTRRAGTVPPGSPQVACRHVRQVRFNAWHYAETDLWASLVAEMFNQLGRTADGDELRRQARLRAELVRRTKVPQRLAEVQAYLASTADRDVLPAYVDLPANVRERWVEAVGPDRAEAVYASLNHSAEALQRRVTGPLAVAWAVAKARPWRTVLLLGVVLAVIAVVAWAASTWWGTVAAVATTLAAVFAVVTPLLSKAAGTARAGWGVLRSAARQVSVLDTTRAVARAEEAQLHEEYERLVAGGQLAGVLEQRVQDGSYRSRLGLMSQIRDDFGEMAELLIRREDGPIQEAGEPGVDGELPHIDRIVLYVDDLDRCPPGRVVEVLEAIHLLLAVRLFVVVVAVDPRWLLQALTTHYRGLLRSSDDSVGDEDDLWRSTPLHYLEKIFQIPFTLSPLDTTRYGRFVDGLLARPTGSSGPTGPGPAAAAGAALDAEARTESSSTVRRETSPTARFEPRADLAPRLSAPPRNDQVDPLLLDDEERAFLKLLGPPLLTSPRSTKRLLNSYGLLLSLEGHEGRLAMLRPTDDDDGPPPHRAALTLLATVIARPDASPAFFRHLHEATPGKPWRELLDLERSRLGRVDLVEVLDQLTEAAASAGRPLPATVGGFRPWVVKAGRLSFQTGREVVRLG
jgi:hypothetical protein